MMRAFVVGCFCLISQLLSVQAYVILPTATTATRHGSLPGSTQLFGASPEHGGDDEVGLSRRQLLASLLAATTAAVTTTMEAAHATLVQFPCKNGLRSKYHFMRAGESELEADNRWGTNPMFLTNRENALSEFGKEQVRESCKQMSDLAVSYVRYPLAANALDTAHLVKEELLIPGNAVIPEYTYLDQRGIGEWDMFPLDTTQDAIWALDATDAGKEGRGGLPPPNTDGTPNETLYNQVTRLRQLISITETSCSGDNILFIFPDGTGPALLSCLIAGIPLNRAHELHFAPGEVRTDITYDSVRAMLPNKPTVEYLEVIERGKVELERRRAIRAASTKVEPSNKPVESTTAASKVPWAERDLKRREGQMAKRQQQNDSAADKRAQDAARREKARQSEREARQAIANQNRAKMEGVNPSLFAIGALGTVTAMSTFRQSPSESEEAAGKKEFMRQKEAQVPVVEDAAKEEETEASSSHQSVDKFPEIEAMEELVETASFGIPEYPSQQSDNLYPNNLQPPRPIRDEIQMALEAEKAMEDYLNQDDGAEAFDSLLAQMLEDDDF